MSAIKSIPVLALAERAKAAVEAYGVTLRRERRERPEQGHTMISSFRVDAVAVLGELQRALSKAPWAYLEIESPRTEGRPPQPRRLRELVWEIERDVSLGTVGVREVQDMGLVLARICGRLAVRAAEVA